MAHPAGAELIGEYHDGLRRSDALFAAIAPPAITSRLIPERHRLIFYLGHLEAFDWNLLAIYTLGWPSFQPAFDRLFSFGIDPPPGELPTDRVRDWPRREEIENYNRMARERLAEALPHLPQMALAQALEHRLMHLETLAYLLHQMPPKDKQVAAEGTVAAAPRRGEWAEVPAGRAWLGRSREAPGYGWDNEFEGHTAAVPAFAIGRYNITNGEYLEFVRAGGPPPPFWRGGEDGRWRLLAMSGEIPLPLDAPVYVSQVQAAAYAARRGARLPTEAEWHRAAYGSAPPGNEPAAFPWGARRPSAMHGNFDFARWDPVPVTAFAAGNSPFGVRQMLGNGWEWTSTRFAPFPGFAPDGFYPGYSQNFFDAGHYVLKGAGPRTAMRLLRRTFRNWFRPEYPYVHATIRLAR